jgi:predicted transcriptional regulator of viral defense system
MYRLSELIRLDKKLYHTNDLAILWGIANKQTLYMTITRYVDKGILFPVFKGLYSTIPLASLSPIELGKAIIHRYTYLTTESVLSQAGIISQRVYDYTFVADQSKRVTVNQWSFRFRKLKAAYLYNPTGITNENGVFVASPDRAVADMLYYNPRYHFDVPESIDFDRVKLIQKEIGYP